MKVAMLTGSLSREGGGVYEIVRALSSALVKQAVNVEVFGLQDNHTVQDRETWAPLEPKAYVTFGPKALGYAKGLSKGLLDSGPDIVHQHGLWMYPSLASCRWKRKTGKIHVITPQGMLEPWVLKHHRWRKGLVWHLFEKRNLEEADCINVNTMAELEHIRALGLKTPVCVVPNGVDLPTIKPVSENPPWHGIWPADSKILLYLGRLHPKKAIKELVQAWAAASGGGLNQNWRLAIIGWEQNGYGAEVNQLISAFGLQDHVNWFGPAFGPNKEAALKSAHAFALPSFSEGFPMAGLEAWAHSLPLLMTRECNLDVGFTARAALEVRPEIASISSGLQQLWSMPSEELGMMGCRGRALVEKHYTWRKVAAEMKAVYCWLAGQGPQPTCVSLD